jgi:predicted kinase
MASCPQDPVHHAEGDVWTHTRMVIDALLDLPAFQALEAREQRVVYLACLLHDVAKPWTTQTEPDGHISAHGHSRAGELFVRPMLWSLGVPFDEREAICSLIRWHQVPFFLVDREDPVRLAREISLSVGCDLLALVAEADIRGRICADMPRILDQIELFRLSCEDDGCLSTPRAFASPHTRVQYFRSTGRHPDVEAFDDTRGEMIVMCGIPGSGKDTWVRSNAASLPVVCLDDLRDELDIGHDEAQGQVVQEARERARQQLRKGASFVWNATNLSRQRRGPIESLAFDYGARVKIVYVEVPVQTLRSQNQSRPASVPEAAIERMVRRWEMPSLTEAHEIELAVR